MKRITLENGWYFLDLHLDLKTLDLKCFILYVPILNRHWTKSLLIEEKNFPSQQNKNKFTDPIPSKAYFNINNADRHTENHIDGDKHATETKYGLLLIKARLKNIGLKKKQV